MNALDLLLPLLAGILLGAAAVLECWTRRVRNGRGR